MFVFLWQSMCRGFINKTFDWNHHSSDVQSAPIRTMYKNSKICYVCKWSKLLRYYKLFEFVHSEVSWVQLKLLLSIFYILITSTRLQRNFFVCLRAVPCFTRITSVISILRKNFVCFAYSQFLGNKINYLHCTKSNMLQYTNYLLMWISTIPQFNSKQKYFVIKHQCIDPIKYTDHSHRHVWKPEKK